MFNNHVSSIKVDSLIIVFGQQLLTTKTIINTRPVSAQMRHALGNSCLRFQAGSGA